MTQLVAELNDYILKKYGDTEPILNKGNLEFCLWKSLRDAKNQKEDFYKIWTSSTLLQIAKVHPFTEGNKRTSYVVSKLILLLGKYDFEINYDDAVHYLRKIAAGKVPFKEVFAWVHKHAKESNNEPYEEIKHFVELLKKATESDL